MAKILVIDDDPAGQRLIKYMLTPDGHEVITASNGIQGLQAATQQSPSLVILDVMLPGIDGFEVCRRLCSAATTKSIPIIMLSGKAQASDRDTGLKMGADEYLVKPVDRQELRDIVNRLLTSTAGSEESKKGKVIAFIGVRGGSGTSTIVTNTAIALGKAKQETLLVDLNPSFSALGEILGLTIDRSVAGLFRDASKTVNVEELKGLFEQHRTGIRLLWAETFPDETAVYTGESVKMVFTELGALADILLVDVPVSPNENAVTALTLADHVVLVAAAGKELADRIKPAVSRLNRFGVTSEKLKLVIVDKSGSTETERITGLNTIDGLPVIGLIHYAKDECEAAEAEAVPVMVCSPSSQIAQDFKKLASGISNLK